MQASRTAGRKSGSKFKSASYIENSDTEKDDSSSEEEADEEEQEGEATVPQEAVMASLAKKIMRLKSAAKVGYANWRFCPRKEDEARQPKMLTQQLNPRGASNADLDKFDEQCELLNGGLDQKNTDFAMTVLIDPSWIANLDEIREWASVNKDLIEIEWTAEAAGKEATMCNGFHRFLSLLRRLKAKYDEREDLRLLQADYHTLSAPTAKETRHKETADKAVGLLDEYLEIHGSFIVLFYDQCEC